MTRLAARVLVVVLPLGACSPDPEKLGDECDPDAGCPSSLVCAPSGDDHICYATPGGICDKTGPDYCLDSSVCGQEGTCQIPLGESCSTEGVDYCLSAAVCGANGTCQAPPGGACDPAGPDLCLDDAVCGKTRDGTGICGIAEGGECDPEQPLCAGGLTCAELVSGGYACYPPVLAQGVVLDSATGASLEGAHVLALDDQATAITDVAISDGAGNYVLDVPVPRNDDGSPIEDVLFTLRASAKDYQPFPGGLRAPLPISSSEAASGNDGWVIEAALTSVALLSLPMERRGSPSISGAVLADKESGGVLVVAEDASGKGVSAVSDRGGAYTIFNVPAGSYQVRGYAAGLQLDPATAEVGAADLTGVDLARGTAELGTVRGIVRLVNAPGGSATSVVLMVASTFNDTLARGEVPRGLRTPLGGPPTVNSSFGINAVPAGDYVALATFDNDGLVRDADPNIADTQIARVSMPSPGEFVSLDESLKVTAALPLLGPGAEAPEPVTAAPTLRWGDDSSEDFYTVFVYNAHGDLVWCRADDGTCDGPSIPGVRGAAEVSVRYGGPLEPGMYYQFRATSWRSPSTPGPIATTEDLRGVFYVEGQ